MKLEYISPSTLPSRSANSVHVAWQCDALVKAGAEVRLFARRSVREAGALPAALHAAYGIDASEITLATFFSAADRAVNLRIAAMAASMIRHSGVIVSRNLYAAHLFGVWRRRPLLFETHQLEIGVRKAMQRAVMTRPWITTVVISEQLKLHLARHHGVEPARTLVLHDAAPDGAQPLPPQDRRPALLNHVPDAAGNWKTTCGYFGHLYPGRGIDVVEAAARLRPESLFLVYGGNDRDVANYRDRGGLPNLKFMGHVPHFEARAIMKMVDVLLMPYQQSVSLGVRGHDTARWMSPVKMFEYLSAGVPIIASDLPALREVLRHESNALLVAGGEPEEWAEAIDRITLDATLAARLGTQAHSDYREKYTWTQRARSLLAAAHTL